VEAVQGPVEAAGEVAFAAFDVCGTSRALGLSFSGSERLAGLQLSSPAVPICPAGIFLVPERRIVSANTEQVAEIDRGDNE
jgi:hypothetical protein